MESFGFAAVVAGVPPLGGRAVQVPEHAKHVSLSVRRA